MRCTRAVVAFFALLIGFGAAPTWTAESHWFAVPTTALYLTGDSWSDAGEPLGFRAGGNQGDFVPLGIEAQALETDQQRQAGGGKPQARRAHDLPL